MGIGSQLANLMQFQGPHASNEFLFAVSAIGDHITTWRVIAYERERNRG
jgi:hypothetical protein